MLRFVHAPDGDDGTGALTPDLARQLPGDDLWVVNRKSAVEKLAALPELNAPHDLPIRVEKLMRQNVTALISLARKAGKLVAGFSKTEAALKAGSVKLLLAAHDGAEDGRRKLANKAKAMNIALCSVLSSNELGMALGQENVIHAGLTDVGWAERIERDAGRLAAYRGDIDGRMSE
jgi:ribosomal protein L7Ae-like RNA K-turn-binding protein